MPEIYYTIAIKMDGTLWAWGSNNNSQLGDSTTTNRIVPTKIGLANDWKQISCGVSHTIGIKTDGTLWAWGYNYYGQLGDHTTVNKKVPTKIGTANNWRSIECGSNHSLAIATDGSLWAWGYNSSGQLGDATTVNKTFPRKIGTANNWQAIKCGGGHSIGLKSDGSLWTWGFNSSGQLGDGTTINKNIPSQIDIDKSWQAIACGTDFTYATNYTLANNVVNLITPINNQLNANFDISLKWTKLKTPKYRLQLSTDSLFANLLMDIYLTDTTASPSLSASSKYFWRVKALETLDSTEWSSIWSFTTKSSIITCPKLVAPLNNDIAQYIPIEFIWNKVNGANSYRILISSDSLFIKNLVDISLSDTSYLYTSAIDILNNTKYFWRVRALNATDTGAYSAMNSFSTVNTVKQNLWAWGYNGYGQIGDGTLIDKTSPIIISTSNDWRLIAGFSYHNLAIKADSTLWAWGQNSNGELGDGTSINKSSPTKIGTANNWQYVMGGGSYSSFGIQTDGTLWAWGSNTFGNLGDGTYVNESVPTRIGTANNWQTVVAGFYVTVALKTDGTLWAWGDNYNGEIGDGTTVDKSVPTQIGTANNWQTISKHGDHTLAIKTDGTLWAWGSNYSGQLGDGTTTNRSVPTQIGTANDWLAISARTSHSIAIKTDGTLWAWGENYNGQLGDGTTTQRNSPTKIGVANNWKSISTSAANSHAIKSDGSLWAWGNNASYQLGDGTSNQKMSPTRIGTSNNWLAIDCGNGFTKGLRVALSTYKPKLLSPLNTAIDQPTVVKFTWLKIPDKEKTRFQIASDNAFTNIIKDSLAIADSLILTLNTNVNYFWRVKSLTTVDSTIWSDVWTFKTKVPVSAPSLVAPLNNSLKVVQPITLVWNKPSFATNYKINIALDSAFTNIAQSLTSTDTSKIIPNLLSDTKYYWRIKASASVTDSSEWSSVWNFKTDSIITSTISGVVSYKNSVNTKLNGTKVKLYQDTTFIKEAIADTNGVYTINGVPNGTYRLELSTTKARLSNCFNIQDVAIIRMFVGLVLQFDTLQIKATNVNMDYKNGKPYVNIQDVSILRMKNGGVATPTWVIPDWLFAIETAPNVFKTDMNVIINGSNQTVNIKALCSGDVNGSFVPAP